MCCPQRYIGDVSKRAAATGTAPDLIRPYRLSRFATGHLVEGPVKHGLEAHREQLFRKPAGNRMEPGAESPTRDHRGIERHGAEVTSLGWGGRRTRVSCTLKFWGREQRVRS